LRQKVCKTYRYLHFWGLFKISRYRKTLPALSIGWAQFFFFSKNRDKDRNRGNLGERKKLYKLIKKRQLIREDPKV
jgi:hypothetical protein